MRSLFSLRTEERLARSIPAGEHEVYAQFCVTRCNLGCEQRNRDIATGGLAL